MTARLAAPRAAFGSALLAGMLAAKALALAVVPAPVAVVGWLPWDDVMVAAALAALASAWPRAMRAALLAAGVGLAAFSLLLVRATGVPLLPSLLRGFDPAMGDSVAPYLDLRNLTAALGVVGAAATGAWLARGRALRRRTWTLVALAAGVLAAAAPPRPVAHRNALVAFVRACLPRSVPAPPVVVGGERPIAAAPVLRAGAAAGRSVVLVVLESAAPRFGQAMPFLRELAASGLACTDAAAVYPESIEGQVAVFCGVPPMPDAATTDYARHLRHALPHTLRTLGYRSGLFHSGRFDFLGMRDLVGAMGFDVLADAATLRGARESSFGIDEETAIAALLAWLGELPPAQRAFACWLPIAGHHPYASPGGGPFATDTQLGCYQNALHYADRSLRELWRGLCALRPPEHWLLCVVGDHGQAFGEHAGNFGHAFAVYEENLRVPWVLVAPGAIAPGSVHDAPCSHLDLAPTLLDLLGRGDGRGLCFAPDAQRCAFTDWGDLQVAARTRDWKLMHDVASGHSQLFARAVDPDERHDVAAAHPEVSERLRAASLAWLAAARAGPRP